MSMLFEAPSARRGLGEQAADLDVALVGDDHRHLVEEAVDLRVHRGDDLLGPVPEVLAADAADEVEVLAAVEILDRSRRVRPRRRASDCLLRGRRSARAHRSVALRPIAPATPCSSPLGERLSVVSLRRRDGGLRTVASRGLHAHDRHQLGPRRELRQLADGQRRGRDPRDHLGQRRLRLPRQRPGDDDPDGRAVQAARASRSARIRACPTCSGSGAGPIRITPDDCYAYVLYQTGALQAVLAAEGMTLHHLKPHGAFYSILREDEPLAAAFCDAAARAHAGAGRVLAGRAGAGAAAGGARARDPRRHGGLRRHGLRARTARS